MPRKVKIGDKYHRLTVIGFAEDHIAKSGRRYAQVVCRCDCGSVKTYISQSITSGGTYSCGCYQKEINSQRLNERNTTHGYAYRTHGRNRLYQLWSTIKRRCYNQNDKTYPRYGGIGITMCDDWKNSFESFKDWALSNGYDIDAPRGECTIDRIDPTKGYCPENCRFVGMDVQGDNRSCVKHIEYNGETHNFVQWGKITGIKPHTLHARYDRGDRGDKLFRPVRK